ncbi:hypothetical protein ABW19_dt0203876 [Dactylella cylindrospora]|nr:hypothetical protein ABW19_dt0203876 [Dactylella cylindrospora]
MKTLSLTVPSALLSLLFSVAVASNCCDKLESLYPSKLFYPLQLTYTSQNNFAYWAAQSVAKPGCVFTAKSVKDVSNAVKVLHANKCEYAIRSGGHNPIPGWSNTDGGVLLSTSDIKDVTYDAASNTVKFGAGCKWKDVYDKLDPLGVSTMGGRDNTVGTGGFLLGGGISYYSNLRGWAADHVTGFEVVYANGTIGTITQQTYPDLFAGMKGAGSSLAIVTHFIQETFTQKKYNAGFLFYAESSVPKLLTALYNYSTVGALVDPKSHIIPAITQATGPDLIDLATFCFFYPQALGLGEAEVFKPFTKDIIPVGSTKRDRVGLNSISGEIGGYSPAGRRQSFTDMAIVLDNSTILHDIYNAFVEASSGPRLQILGYSASFIFYPLTRKFVSEGRVNRKKNIIGLENTPAGRAGKTIMIVCINLTWLSEAQDTIAKAFVDDAMAKMKAVADARGLYHAFKYMNYADGTQDVISGYGSASVSKLRKLKAEVDPTNDFGTLVKGRYPIPGV